MSDPISLQGGRSNWTTGEAIGSDDLNNMGKIMEQCLLHLVSRLLRPGQDHDSNPPRSGVFGADMAVTYVSGLDVSVEKGIGFYYDSTETDEYASHYKPIVVETDTTKTLSAHDATHPRIDVISVAPAVTTEDSVADQVKDPGTGVVSSQTIDKRLRWSSTITVTEGTPAASPAAPATPSGHIKLAEVTVPAVSGAFTVSDSRPQLFLSLALQRHMTDIAIEDVDANSWDVDEFNTNVDSFLGQRGAAGVPLSVEGTDGSIKLRGTDPLLLIGGKQVELDTPEESWRSLAGRTLMGYADTRANWDNSAGSASLTINDSNDHEIWVPMDPISGTYIESLDLYFNMGNTGGQLDFEFVRVTLADGTATQQGSTSSYSGGSGTGDLVLSVDPDTAYEQDLYAYYLVIRANNQSLGAGTVKIHGTRIHYKSNKIVPDGDDY